MAERFIRLVIAHTLTDEFGYKGKLRVYEHLSQHKNNGGKKILNFGM